jgi:hypothetical protein
MFSNWRESYTTSARWLEALDEITLSDSFTHPPRLHITIWSQDLPQGFNRNFRSGDAGQKRFQFCSACIIVKDRTHVFRKCGV